MYVCMYKPRFDLFAMCYIITLLILFVVFIYSFIRVC